MKALHRVRFPGAGLPVREDGGVVPLQGAVDDPLRSVFVHVLLGGALVVDMVEREAVRGVGPVLVQVPLLVHVVWVLAEGNGSEGRVDGDDVLERGVPVELQGKGRADPNDDFEVAIGGLPRPT